MSTLTSTLAVRLLDDVSGPAGKAAGALRGLGASGADLKKLAAASPEMAQMRFDVGRGLQANYFTFELFNKNGGDFEIDSVSFFAAEFKRRI